MHLFGKKLKGGRAASLKSATLVDRLTELLSDRSVLIRLAVVVVATIAFVFAVEGWRPVFRYRIGDRIEHGIAARVQFSEVNQQKTEAAQRRAEELVPFVFERDSSPLKTLPATLRNHLAAVAGASGLANLSPEAAAAFQLTVDNVPVAGAQKTFEDLRIAVGSGDAIGEKIDQLTNDFEQFLEPLREFGVVAESRLTDGTMVTLFGGDVPRDHAIEIVGDDDPTPATMGDVLLVESIKNTGRLGRRWTAFPRFAPLRPFLERWMAAEVPETLRFDAAETAVKRQLAREGVGDKFDIYKEGTLLAPPGSVLDEDLLKLLWRENAEVAANASTLDRIGRGAIALMMFVVLAVLFGIHLFRSEPQIISTPSRLGIFLGTCVVTVWLARLVSVDPWRAEVVPIVAASMLIAIAYNQVLATLTAFVICLVVSLSTVVGLEHFVVLMIVSVAAILPLGGVSSRSTLIKTGVLVSTTYLVVSWAAGILVQGSGIAWTDWQLLKNSLQGAGWCFLSCTLLVGAMLPFIEARFGIVTDLSLLELSNISHPLLQELVRRAPGTYNHSISVATIAEAAAESIGANGLLTRVGAYYHDIGKMLKPEYFIENNSGEGGNRHEHLAPAMSTLIIIGHVKGGVELAREHNLPPAIVDFVEQHHGTTLVEYFFHEATRQADADHKSDAEEASYRYPGPKPQTRETGIMMLADAVESASRTLSEPTPKRIESLVHQITMKRLLDGQFDECAMTLSEIHAVEDSLIKSLTAIYHGRIKYPEQQTA